MGRYPSMPCRSVPGGGGGRYPSMPCRSVPGGRGGYPSMPCRSVPEGGSGPGGVGLQFFLGGACLQFFRGSFIFRGVSNFSVGGPPIFRGSPIFWGGSPIFRGVSNFSEYGQHSAGTHPTGMHSCLFGYVLCFKNK